MIIIITNNNITSSIFNINFNLNFGCSFFKKKKKLIYFNILSVLNVFVYYIK